MIWPIKLFTTEDSFLIVRVVLPIWFTTRTGFKPERTVKDRWFHPQLTCSWGEEIECLHAYVIAFGFRIRSNKTMKTLKGGSKQILCHARHGWTQVFTSAIV